MRKKDYSGVLPLCGSSRRQPAMSTNRPKIEYPSPLAALAGIHEENTLQNPGHI